MSKPIPCFHCLQPFDFFFQLTGFITYKCCVYEASKTGFGRSPILGSRANEAVWRSERSVGLGEAQQGLRAPLKSMPNGTTDPDEVLDRWYQQAVLATINLRCFTLHPIHLFSSIQASMFWPYPDNISTEKRTTSAGSFRNTRQFFL